MTDLVLQRMLDDGLLQSVGADTVEDFIDGDGLRLLFFSGKATGQGHDHGHDVAVALRELLRDYPGQIATGWINHDEQRALMGRFRVAVIPSLVFVVGGEVMEVLPRVRDWVDYQAAFRRYLGVPQSTSSPRTTENAS